MKTNLDKIKEIAIMFLYLDPTYTDIKLPIFISHPFFESSILMDYETHEMYNIFENKEMFEKNRTMMKELIKKDKSAQSIFLMIRKPYQLTFFKYVKEYLSEKDFAKLLISSWTLTEFNSNDKNVTKNEFISWFKKANKYYMMDESEIKVFNDLPENITIYRGVGDRKYKNGISWTLDKEKAIWFSKRFDFHDKHVYQGMVSKNDILAYIDQCNEQEIIVDPKTIKNIGEI